jgi:outer membrane biosynthesis protein TonB
MGYKGPKIARGLHPSGYEEVLVHNVAELAKVNSETQAVRIAHTVGKKKRVQIISEAKKLGLVILNFKEVKEPVKEEEAKEEAKPEKAEEKPAEKPAEKKKEKLKKPEKPKPKKAAKGEKPKKTGKKPKTEEGAKKQ